MKHFRTLLAHEIRMLLLAPSTYVAAVLYLGVMGFIFQGILEAYSREAQDNSPGFVFFQLFWLPVFFMVPLLTMKCVSEERRSGTLETLLTTPVTTAEVLLGKYVAAYLLYLTLWLSTLGFSAILFHFAQDVRLIDPGPLIGGYLFIAVSGLLFIAIGIFASSVARSQAVAGILAFALLFALIIGPRLLGELPGLDAGVMLPLREFLESAQVFQHRDDFVRGVVDTRQIVFYSSASVLTLVLSIFGLEFKILQS